MRIVVLTITLVSITLLVGCSEDNYLGSFAQVTSYRVENTTFGTDSATIHVEKLVAISNDKGDTLTTDDFDSLEVTPVHMEDFRGELQYSRSRGTNGKYHIGILYIDLGNVHKMHFQERY